MWRTIFLLALSQFGFVPVRVDGTEIFCTLSPLTNVAHPPFSASHHHGALLTLTDNNGNSPSLRIHSLGYTEGRTPSIRLEMGVRDWAHHMLSSLCSPQIHHALLNYKPYSLFPENDWPFSWAHSFVFSEYKSAARNSWGWLHPLTNMHFCFFHFYPWLCNSLLFSCNGEV